MGSVLFAAFFVALQFATGLANPDSKRLYDDLLSNYNRLIRPVGNNSDRLTVKMGLRLSQLIDVVSTCIQTVDQQHIGDGGSVPLKPSSCYCSSIYFLPHPRSRAINLHNIQFCVPSVHLYSSSHPQLSFHVSFHTSLEEKSYLVTVVGCCFHHHHYRRCIHTTQPGYPLHYFAEQQPKWCSTIESNLFICTP